LWLVSLTALSAFNVPFFLSFVVLVELLPDSVSSLDSIETQSIVAVAILFPPHCHGRKILDLF